MQSKSLDLHQRGLVFDGSAEEGANSIVQLTILIHCLGNQLLAGWKLQWASYQDYRGQTWKE